MQLHTNAQIDETPFSRSLPLPRHLLPRPEWLPASQWPFSTFGMDMDGSTLAVTEVGKGPTLLLVHTGMWSFLWREVMLRLAPDFHCVCFDAPGTGQSARLPASAITLENAARAVHAVIERLDLRDLALVVHDLGGPAGIAGAAQVPDRIRGIASLNAFAWRPSGTFFRGMLALMGSAPIRELDVLTRFLYRITASSFGVGRHLEEPGRQAFLDGVRHHGGRTFHYYMRDARRCDALYQRVEAALVGPFRKLPLLTIFGERNDPLGFQKRWKSLYPDARQLVVAGGNHFPMCDDPQLVASELRSWHKERVAPSIAAQGFSHAR